MKLLSDPHFSQIVCTKLPADQANAGNGGDDKNNQCGVYNHGDLLSPFDNNSI
jgi:hypothetical protein